MKSLILTLLFATTFGVQAQTIVFKDGKTLEGKNLRRSGNSVMSTVAIGTGQGEVGYAVASISRIDFPPAPQIPIVEDLLVTGKAAEALVQIEAVVNAQAPFKDIPGNQWLEAVNLRLTSLHALGRDTPAPLFAEMTATTSDPEIVLSGQMWQAAALVKSDSQKALAVLDQVIKKSTRKDTLASAWLRKSFCLAELDRPSEAVVAALHVPVFFPEQKPSMPPALLVSAQAFFAMEDFPMAKRSMEDIVKGFPNSSEAKIAQTELPKIERRIKATQTNSAKPPAS